jgi:hypothetical protein
MAGDLAFGYGWPCRLRPEDIEAGIALAAERSRHRARAVLELSRGSAGAARSALKEAILEDPGDPLVGALDALVIGLEGDTHRARVLLDEVTRRFRGLPETLASPMVFAVLERGREDAAFGFEKALDILNSGAWGAGVAVFARLEAWHPDDLRFQAARAVILAISPFPSTRDRAKARELVRSIRARSPEPGRAVRSLVEQAQKALGE